MQKVIGLLFLGIALLAASGGPASAQVCAAGCGVEAKACLKAARMTKLACTMDCRANSAPTDLGACLVGCVDAFRTAKTSCRSGVQGCVQGCGPTSSGGDPACLGACGAALGQCARGVAATGRECVQGCRTASDRLGCLEACGTAARSGAGECAATALSCAAGCGGGGGSTTTTTTTLPVPSCESSTAPACGGACPSSVQQCMPVSPTRCACVGGSASPAFLE
jgi:hypothetical protein